MGVAQLLRIVGPWVAWIALAYWSLENLPVGWFMVVYLGGGLAATLTTTAD